MKPDTIEYRYGCLLYETSAEPMFWDKLEGGSDYDFAKEQILAEVLMATGVLETGEK